MRDQPFCFSHHPDHKADAAEAQTPRWPASPPREDASRAPTTWRDGLRSGRRHPPLRRRSAPSTCSAWTPPSPAQTPCSGAPSSPPSFSKWATSRSESPSSKPRSQRASLTLPLTRCRSQRDRCPVSIPPRSARDRRACGAFPELSSCKKRAKTSTTPSPQPRSSPGSRRSPASPPPTTMSPASRTGPVPPGPLHRLTTEAERAATASSKGLPRDTIDRKVREAVRDVVFFVHLHLKLSSVSTTSCRARPSWRSWSWTSTTACARTPAGRTPPWPGCALAHASLPARCRDRRPPSRPPSNTASSPGACSRGRDRRGVGPCDAPEDDDRSRRTRRSRTGTVRMRK